MAGSIKKIRTPAELRAISRSQVGAEIQSQVGPYTSEKNNLISRRQRALTAMNKLYTGLQGYNQQVGQTMAGFQEQSGQLQNQAFQQAMTRLDQFRQQRGAEAQALAQQTGGPVPISAFTEGIDPGNIAPSSAAGALMGAIGGGQDQMAEVDRFNREVFPLIQQEETKGVRQDFEDKVREVQDQIATIKGQRGGLVNKRYSELLGSERDYQLASGALGVNKRQLALQTKTSINPRTGRPYAVEADERNFLYQKKQDAVGKLGDNQTQSAYDLLDAWTSPTSEPKVVTTWTQAPAGYLTKSNKPKDGYIATDKQGNPIMKLNAAGKPVIQNGQYVYLWYHTVKNSQTIPGGQAKVDDPTMAYKRLLEAGIPKGRAIEAVKSYWDVPDNWHPGDVAKSPKADLSSGLPSAKRGAKKVAKKVRKGAHKVSKGVAGK